MTTFHRMIVMRHKRNTISIIHTDSDILPDEVDIRNHIDNSFQSLFGLTNAKRWESTPDFWPPAQQTGIDLQGLEEEVIASISQLGVNKAPGPNGSLILFYKNFWDVICLLNESFKIISKALANSLRMVFPSLIGEYQSRFIVDRCILDGVAVAQVATQFCHQKSIDAFMLKLDFEKGL